MRYADFLFRGCAVSDNIFAPPRTPTQPVGKQAFGAQPGFELATLEQRLGAKLIDWALGLSVWMPGFVAVALFGGPDAIADDDVAKQMMVALPVLIGLVALVVVQWGMLAMRAQTVGKWALGIHIRRTDGRFASFMHTVVLREWIIGFATGMANTCCLGPVVWFVDVIVGVGSERRCMHDHIADTHVVKGHPPQ